MKDCKGNPIGVGTLLFANKGKYGPCAKIVGTKNDCAVLQHGTVLEDGSFFPIPQFDSRGLRESFIIKIDQMANTYWASTQSVWQEIAQHFRRSFYQARYELSEAIKQG